ncbi:hypothetical protein [Aquimarina sediminis]|uniref:hypothetical protein n=1 Tax=Aquimarina sediminis TaxID=2070536 RepID=UPI000CA076E0|nr:hypothetical protein [Aquimarina sediminis]
MNTIAIDLCGNDKTYEFHFSGLSEKIEKKLELNPNYAHNSENINFQNITIHKTQSLSFLDIIAFAKVIHFWHGNCLYDNQRN